MSKFLHAIIALIVLISVCIFHNDAYAAWIITPVLAVAFTGEGIIRYAGAFA